MNKVYDHKNYETDIYKMWEEGKHFTPEIDLNKKPFTIILPLPNANDPMHMGHALFTIQDILTRYHRMQGFPTLWLPGGDHAGIETQFVFEKKLTKKGESRFDYDRETLYKLIEQFANENKDLNKNQMKRLGFSLDWSRYHYSLEPEIVEKVFDTFRQLHKDNLIYRENRMVNYCTKCGTAFSDLETNHEEKDEFLYYLSYESISIATTRPETIFADVAVAVNPNDKKHKGDVGKIATIPLINKEIPIIADSAIDTGFGTGALKVTPAHDTLDYEIGLRHDLPVIETLDKNGRMINVPEKYTGMKVSAARQAVLEDLKHEGKLIKTKPLKHTISVCYRCGTTIEPMLIPQWYLKTKPLAKPAIDAVKSGKTKIAPKKRFEKLYFDWLENIMDWNISRQIVWGPRIPAWYCLDCNPEIQINFINKDKQNINAVYNDIEDKYSFEEIRNGLQNLSAPVDAKYSLDKSRVCLDCGGKNILQETDTFDTWFLSGQWPLTTLGYPDSEDFKYFYPTSVMDTLWDILFFWVARMMMLGIYRTGEVPFKVVHLHARVVDSKGKKMSKSKGNVINPLDMVEKYGADALRSALVFGVSPASDVVMSDDKVRAMRNFGNKVWNIGRFLKLSIESAGYNSTSKLPNYSEDKFREILKVEDKKIIKKCNSLISKTTKYLSNYRFDLASENVYHFLWDDLASDYLEHTKTRKDKETTLSVFRHVYLNSLKLLHPFMPFITETIWQELKDLRDRREPLIVSSWPKT
jgi:valyl-tRNA synthetase